MFCQSKDWQLLRTLSTCVRIIAPYQLARWWGVPSSNARRSLQKLEERGLVSETTVLARRLPPIAKPILRWKPAMGEPDYGGLSYLAKKRFKKLPPKPTKAYIAAPKGLSQFTDKRSIKIKRGQATHDLGVTEAYLFMLKRWPCLTQLCWRGEDQFAASRGHCEKVEDAHLVCPKTGRLLLAIEYAGTYPKERFSALHDALKNSRYWIL